MRVGYGSLIVIFCSDIIVQNRKLHIACEFLLRQNVSRRLRDVLGCNLYRHYMKRHLFIQIAKAISRNAILTLSVQCKSLPCPHRLIPSGISKYGRLVKVTGARFGH